MAGRTAPSRSRLGFVPFQSRDRKGAVWRIRGGAAGDFQRSGLADFEGAASPGDRIKYQHYREANAMKLEVRIQQYLTENLLFVEEGVAYDFDTSFISEGLIDSMGIAELVAYIESEFGIKVQQHEITMENFDSINKLAAYIRQKQVSSEAASA